MTTAIDTIPNIRDDWLIQFIIIHIRILTHRILHTEASVAIDSTKFCIIITHILGTTVTTCKYRREYTSSINIYRCGEFLTVLIIQCYLFASFRFNGTDISYVTATIYISEHKYALLVIRLITLTIRIRNIRCHRHSFTPYLHMSLSLYAGNVREINKGISILV